MKLRDGLVLSKAKRTWIYKSSVSVWQSFDLARCSLTTDILRKSLLQTV